MTPTLSIDAAHWETVKGIAAVFGILSGGVVVCKALLTLFSKIAAALARRRLAEGIGGGVYDSEEIRRATTHYVAPDFQSLDPSGLEDFRRAVCAREPAFAAMDRLLQAHGEYKYLILLADSGMGKTSFVLNYYAYHARRGKKRSRFKLVVVPLNIQYSDWLFQRVPPGERASTVLFLDALDEDQRAIQDHRQRLSELIARTEEFRAVLITCRSQFFPKDEEIPSETGLMKVGPVGANQSKAHYFHKLYLSPFSDEQVSRYLKRRFPFRKWRERREAKRICATISDLVARPMLLAHIQDLVKMNAKARCASEVYETMIDAWLERERGLVRDKQALREFCDRLAVDLIANRNARGMERIPEAELEPLAAQYGIRLKGWQLRGRSLLNRDALGNYKFAHRSFMEYLFARQAVLGRTAISKEPWSDLVKSFVIEMIRGKKLASDNTLRLDGADLTNIDLSGLSLQSLPLNGADLTGAQFTGADLACAGFDHATIRRAIFDGCDLRRSVLTRADLTECSLHGTNLQGANLDGACLLHVEAPDAKFPEAKMWGATLVEALFVAADLRDAHLERCKARRVNLESAVMTGARFEGADLTGAVLDRSNMRGAQLAGANFSEASLSDTDLTDAILTDCNVAGAKFSSTILCGADLSSAKGLTQDQIRTAIMNQETKLPDGLSGLEPLYREAVRLVVEQGTASASSLQRRLRVGYGRASKMLDAMEQDGIIGPRADNTPRKVLRRPDWLDSRSEPGAEEPDS